MKDFLATYDGAINIEHFDDMLGVKRMITRAQAEALLTLAESLEACERLGFHIGASMAQGCGIAELTQDTNYLDTELTAVDIRMIVNALIPKQET